MPAAGVEHFDAQSDLTNGIFKIVLTGGLDMGALPEARVTLNEIVSAQPKRLAIDMHGLKSMVPEGARELMVVRGKLPIEEAISVVGANPRIRQLLMGEEFATAIDLQNRSQRARFVVSPANLAQVNALLPPRRDDPCIRLLSEQGRLR